MPATSASTQPQFAELTVAQEQQAKALVDQLSDGAYKVRQAAQAKLVEMGPDIVPLINRLAQDSGAEAARRIREVAKRYRWMTSGALITCIDPGSPADKAGMKVGDIVVKIDGVDVISVAELNNPYPSQSAKTYELRREGQLITVQLPPGPFNIGGHAWWDSAVGSKNRLIAHGMMDLYSTRAYSTMRFAGQPFIDQAGSLDQVYPFFKQTQNELDRDELYALAGAAENALDHQFALDVYKRAADGQDEAYPIRPMPAAMVMGVQHPPLYYGVARQLASLQTSLLLEKWHKNQLAPGDFAQWLLGPGHNLPLARQVVAAKTPRPQNTSESNQQWHNLVLTRMKISLWDHDWAAVLSALDDHLCAATANVALQAAIETMDYAKVYETGLYLAKDCHAGSVNADNAGCVLALAALWLADRNDLADKLLAELKKLDPAILDKLAASTQADALEMPSLDTKTLPLLEELVRNQPMTDLGKRLRRRWSRSPDLTSAKWQALVAKYFPQGPGMVIGRYYAPLEDMLIWCRLGQYNNDNLAPLAAGQVFYTGRGGVMGRSDAPGIGLAVRWLRENQARISADWAQLAGTMTASNGLEKGSHWAVKWDGQVLYVDPQGKITKYDGIEPNAFNDMAVPGSVLTFPTGTIYANESQVYLLDNKLNRWVPTFAWPCWAPIPTPFGTLTPITAGRDMWSTAAAPPVLRYMMANYGTGPGHEVIAYGAGPEACRWWVFNGGIGIAADEKTGEATDFSRQIATLAHKDKPARVFRILPLIDKSITPAAPVTPGPPPVTVPPQPPKTNPFSRLLIATDCGLWMMDAQGKVSRVDLGNKSDLPVAIMDWLRRDGRVYVGITPQDGGQVFELDPPMGKSTLTGGFCTQSPDDVYFVLNDPNNPRRMDYALMAIYANSHKPKTTSQKSEANGK